jgi:putative drug exporter of the RND superfamily
MFFKIGRFVARRWWLVVFVWLLIVCVLRTTAPPWDSVTYDGDLAYLPSRSPSVQGDALLARAFPQDHAKSQLVVVVSRADGPLTAEDIYVPAYDVARRLKVLHGAAALARCRRLLDEAGELTARQREEDAAAARHRAAIALEDAERALDEAAYFDQELLAFLRSNTQVTTARPVISLASIYWNRAQLLDHRGDARAAELDRKRALIIDPGCADFTGKLLPPGAAELPILDIWTWRDKYFGKKLVSHDLHARLIVMQVANEFLALGNQPLLRMVEEQLQAVRQSLAPQQSSDVSVGVSGSTAVGGDMLLSAKESIENTELFTILLIVAILVVVYRAPLLVLIPLISIGVSLMASTNLVAWLAWLAEQPAISPWWQFKVFTTTKIFIVVILFGAGTDYCLFLIARYREELAHGYSPEEATPRALAGVGDALTASAFTTVVGLGMMFFSEFGKFRYSGPVIGLCLTIGLLVCMTLTPALLRACGRWVFWPYALREDSDGLAPQGWAHRFWQKVAQIVCRRPGLILLGSVLALVPLAGLGIRSADHVTYDILSALDQSRPSRQGAETLRQHFPIGESGPLTIVLLRRGADFRTDDAKVALMELSRQLYKVDGVTAVRSIIDPLGEFPPGENIGVAGSATLFARPHSKTEAVFIAQTPEYRADLTRMDVILEFDPFSREAMEALRRIDSVLRQVTGDSSSFWKDALFAYAGPTAAVRDLHDVTLKDRKRIEMLVVLRRPLICLYLIGSVLFTYFVTIGITELFFAYAYGASFEGLDWKVPLFLFVILVAVGQDYNVYLATRVFEEQRRRGPFDGLRFALIRTGGIITSCGVIMAGTFIAMTSVAWADLLPASWTGLRHWLGTGGGLRSMVELGFALALGVLIDTFIVRPILVPAFLALISRRTATRGP